MQQDSETLKSVLDNIFDGLYLVDSDARITYWNRGAERISGFRSSDAVGRKCSEVLKHIENRGGTLYSGCPVEDAVGDGRLRESVVYIRHRDGYRFPVANKVIPTHDARGDVSGAAVVFSDVTSKMLRVKRIEEYQKMVRHDHVSDLRKKRDIEANLHMRFDKLQRYDWPFGVLFIAIDRMDEIVRNYGGSMDEKVVKMVAMTLLNSLRSTDFVSRWDKDVFIAVVGDITEHLLFFIANRSRMLVEQSVIDEAGASISATVSVGASLARKQDTVFTLLKRAEALMRTSAEGGRNRVTIDAEE